MAAACITKAALLAMATELVAHDGAMLDEIVDLACEMVSEHSAVWGDKLSRAHWTLAAHLATVVLNPSAAVGPLASRTLDKLSESYATGAFENAELGSTPYGRLHLALLGSLRRQRAVTLSTEPTDWTLPNGRVV